MARKRDEFSDDRPLMIAPSPVATAPFSLAWRLGCLAAGLLWLLVDAILLALMLAGKVPPLLWLYAAAPLVAIALLIVLPSFWKSWRGALKLLDAILMTAEAWAARAGWVVDFNRDGAIGHVQPVGPAVEDVRPIIYRGRLAEDRRVWLPAPGDVYPDQAEDAVGGAGGLDRAEEDLPERTRVWHLPNSERIREDDLEDFVDGVFTHGWDRETWLGKGMRREVYEGAILLLEQARILEDRKKGFAGRLNVRNARQARRVLDLPPDPVPRDGFAVG